MSAPTLREIARVCHAVNRAYCETLGDTSQPRWDDAPAWQTTSAINGVAFAASHPDATPADSHKSWLAEKVKAGWVLGPVKDPVTKEHPCMLPYDQLPLEQRVKDHLFLAVVRAMA